MPPFVNIHHHSLTAKKNTKKSSETFNYESNPQFIIYFPEKKNPFSLISIWHLL